MNDMPGPTAGAAARGGGWLLDDAPPDSVFTPERLSEEHRLIGRTARQFVDQEVLPALPALEQKDWALARRLVRRAGELGLLGVDVPEAYGGVHLDKVSSLVVSEKLARAASFGATWGSQTILAAVPLVLFGTDAQKAQYLPQLVSGEIIGAYGLSETGSGSDALGAKTRATRQADGSFVLNGEKMWITNGGFADLFIIFAKVDGEHFTAFLVERAFGGLTSGKEEHKMGLHGSSTTAVIMQDVRVPADGVLGEIGKGHKVAFNVLNFARFKLGAACGGGAQEAIAEASRYAAERKQFGQAIAGFGAIKHKLGEMVARAYAVESLLYRTAGLIDARLEGAAPDAEAAVTLAAFEEHAIEASIAKVVGSEMLSFVLDENVQIHGGNGYVSDYPAERHYRDARVNRIFEGTNEINRLLIPGMLARRAAKGELPLLAAARALAGELAAQKAPSSPSGPLGAEAAAVAGAKKAVLMVLGTTMERFGERLADQQEILMSIADMAIDTYAAESATLRATASLERRAPRAELQADAARIFVNDAVLRIHAAGRQALAAIAEGEPLRQLLTALRSLTSHPPLNTVAFRRRLADETVGSRGYPFAG
jgi:alkylation response protein AidB-like acyl-CoA dehydrogenase